MTEATVYQTTHHVQAPADGAIDILVGRPMQGVEVEMTLVEMTLAVHRPRGRGRARGWLGLDGACVDHE